MLFGFLEDFIILVTLRLLVVVAILVERNNEIVLAALETALRHAVLSVLVLFFIFLFILFHFITLSLLSLAGFYPHP